MIISETDLSSLLKARHADPHSCLGMHPVRVRQVDGLVVRAFLKGALRCEVVEANEVGGSGHPMERLAEEGVFEGFIPRRKEVFRYQLRAWFENDEIRQFFDPYSFLPTLGPQDLYLFNEGTEHRIYEKLGAHLRVMDGVHGVGFAVWAPAASRVSVAGNFNGWDGRFHPMRPLGSSGVWELFIPGLGEGEMYKFEIRDQAGTVRMKTDPYGTYFEAPPNNAAIVYDPGKYAWGDGEWIERRSRQKDLDRPISIYEVHFASWRRHVEDANRPLSYREAAPLLADYVLAMGFTHVEFMPLAEHPFTGSWGYQVTGFYAPTHRYGRPEDCMFLVDYLHQRGIGVIMDWVPAHFPRDSFALAEFDGTHLYEHADPRLGAHQDWGTLIFNYGRHEVRCFLIANALAWMDRYHIDGLRVDAVASMLYLDYSRKAGEWIPNRLGGRENLEAIDFIRKTNDLVHHYYPGALMIAEESTAWAGVTRPVAEDGLGYDLKWNMGWMHDTLRYFSKESIHRKWHHNDLTFGMLYQFSERFVSVFSHDEVTHGKASMLYKMGAWHIPEKAATLRALYTHMWAFPGKKLLFMGSEFGQANEWNYAASLDWHLLQYIDHEGIRLLVRDLNALYTGEPALSCSDFNPDGFRWIGCWDAESSIISFLRFDPAGESVFAVVGHFTPIERKDYRIGVPRTGFWKEMINSNSEYYGGSGLGNNGGLVAEDVPADGLNHSIKLVLPPLSTTIFKWTGEA